MEEFDLLNELIQSSQEMVVGGIRIKVAKAAREQYFGDAAHLAHRMIDMEDIDAVIALLSMGGTILLVARSKVPEFDVSRVMREFGGGGHPTAASATIKGEALEIVEERLLELIKVSVKPEKVASDIMTRPVISIQWDVPIKEAEAMMTRYGVNVLPKYGYIVINRIIIKFLPRDIGDNNREISYIIQDRYTAHLDAIYPADW